MLLFDNKDKIVFIGDSVTDAGRLRPIGQACTQDALGTGYVRLIDTFLNVFYPENTYQVVNMGISGQQSRHLVARWQTDVLDLHPNWVVMMIGANDVWRQFDNPCNPENGVMPEAYEQNLRKMIEDTLPYVKGMVLMTPYYMEPCKEDPMRARMDEYGTIVKKLAAEYNLPCVDLQPDFNDYLQYRHSAFIMADRVHPGRIGSMIIARAFLRTVGFDREVI